MDLLLTHGIESSRVRGFLKGSAMPSTLQYNAEEHHTEPEQALGMPSRLEAPIDFLQGSLWLRRVEKGIDGLLDQLLAERFAKPNLGAELLGTLPCFL